MSGAAPATTSSQRQPPARVLSGPADPQLHPEPRLTPPIRSAGGLVVCGDELNADLVLLRDPDLGVKGEGVANDAARPWSPWPPVDNAGVAKRPSLAVEIADPPEGGQGCTASAVLPTPAVPPIAATIIAR